MNRIEDDPVGFSGATGNEAGWSTGLRNVMKQTQNDPYARLRNRVRDNVRFGSFDQSGTQGEPGGGA